MANQRENFESAIMRSLYGQMDTPEELFRRDADGDCYANSVIQSAWWGYQVGGASINRLENEADRQLVLLALANLALLRPGFDHALRTLAGRFGMDGDGLFEQFKELNRDQVGGFVYPPAGQERILPLRPVESAGEVAIAPADEGGEVLVKLSKADRLVVVLALSEHYGRIKGVLSAEVTGAVAAVAAKFESPGHPFSFESMSMDLGEQAEADQ